MKNIIEVRNLSRIYKRGPQEVRALDGVSFDVVEGEFLSVTGSSGSGKTTLLHLLAGLSTPDSGIISVDGADLASFNSRQLAAYRASKIGIVFQSFNLLGGYTALRNVEWGLFFCEKSEKIRTRKAKAILDKLGLKDRFDHLPADLSGGEQQRVALARALVKNPEILFADEPTGNLDRDNSAAIADLLTGLNSEGLTVILVTHDLRLAQKSGQRQLSLEYGKIKSVSVKQDLYEVS